MRSKDINFAPCTNCGGPAWKYGGSGRCRSCSSRRYWQKRREGLEEPNPGGLCQCGCLQPTPIADETSTTLGHVKGKPIRYINGHNKRLPIDETAYVVEDRGYETPCWIWQRSIDLYGYGTIQRDGHHVHAHRLIYEETHGKVGSKHDVHHRCENKACVRPDHMEMLEKATHHRLHKCKLTDEEVMEIHRLKGVIPQTEIAARFGVSRTAISAIHTRRHYGHIPPD